MCNAETGGILFWPYQPDYAYYACAFRRLAFMVLAGSNLTINSGPDNPVTWFQLRETTPDGRTFCVFRLTSPFISKTVRDKPTVIMDH